VKYFFLLLSLITKCIHTHTHTHIDQGTKDVVMTNATIATSATMERSNAMWDIPVNGSLLSLYFSSSSFPSHIAIGNSTV
jgi:hypothetical protein